MSVMSNITCLFLVVATIIAPAFARVLDASYTCCYSAKCPLPVFKQWSGEPSHVLSFSNYIIYETSCCPDNCKDYYYLSGYQYYDTKYGFNSTQFSTGTLQTSCVCNCPQTCDAITAGDDTCDGSCPDASVDDMTTTTTAAPFEDKCTYDPGTGVERPMSQRCYPGTICIDHGKVYDGSYTKVHGLYNGFVQYGNGIYAMRIEEEIQKDTLRKRWVFRLQSNGTKAGSIPTLYFGIDYTDLASAALDVYEGACTPSPTAEPTIPTVAPTPKPTAEPTSPTEDPTRRPTQDPTNRPSRNPTPPTEKPTNRPSRDPTPPTPQPTWPTYHPTVYRPPTPRPTTYIEGLYRPTTSPTEI
eukprot:152944_1